MSRRFAWIFLAAPAALLVAALGATTALAATTWTVTPGGAFSGTGKLALSFDSGGSFTCSSSIAGKLRGGSGPGSHIGAITAMGLTDCAGPPPLQPVWTLEAGGLPWAMNAQSYNSGTTTGKVIGLHLSVAGEGCGFTVDGTAGGKDNGKVTFTYTNGTHVLKLGKPGNLHAYDISGCAGLISNGSPVGLAASYTITPPQKITSP